jgi:pyruvate carboxylase subunit B
MAGVYTVVVDGKKYSVEVMEGEGEVKIEPKQTTQEPQKAKPAPQQPQKDSKVGSIEIKSQTPGTVWKILKNEGDEVNEGDAIMVLEAMKMEIEIVAPMHGHIKTINVKQNDSVTDGMLLATMD